MEKIFTARKWIALFFAVIAALATLLSTVVYVIDPFFQFRVRDNAYELCEYAAGGLIKNYDYDTLIIGSSMTQNFDMDVFREQLGGRPLHIGIGGMSTPEMLELMEASYRSQHAKTFYICADLYRFNDENPTRHIPGYLAADGLLPKCRYLFSNEVWFHYLPLDIGLVILRQAGISLPTGMNIITTIDRYQYWGDTAAFGENIVLDHYKSGEYSVSAVNTENLYNRMTKSIDDFLSGLDFEAGEHIFFFPPYSSLYWCNAQECGYFDEYLQAKRYFVERATEYGATVYDFQPADFTTDLDNYKDTTHYRPEINDWMTECFANHAYIATVENYGDIQAKIIRNTNYFRSQHTDLFN